MCEHDWSPYDDAPFGENPKKYRICTLCKVIGYIKTSAYGPNPSSKYRRKIRPFKCSVRKCGGDAVYRIRGRRDLRCAPLWTCADHMHNYEGLLPKLRDW